MRWRAGLVVAGWDARALLGQKWLWTLAGAFLALALGIARMAMASAGYAGLGGFRRAAAGLLDANLLLVPLLGLTVGASLVATDRESGRMALLLSHPVSRAEAWLGKWLAGALAVSAVVLAGMGLAGLGLFAAGARDPAALAGMALLTLLLAWAGLGLGLLVSSASRTGAQAQGAALVCWLLLVLGGDLVLLAASQWFHPGTGALLAQLVSNPVGAYRIAVLDLLGTPLDSLGPVGQFAASRMGPALLPALVALLALWAAVAPLASYLVARARRGA